MQPRGANPRGAGLSRCLPTRLIFMLPFLATLGSLWLFVALLFKGMMDRSFVSCLLGSWCFLHLLWILVREPRN
jgi:hypothetical protein